MPPGWQAWLRGIIDDLPDKGLPPKRKWEKDPTANLTGIATLVRIPQNIRMGCTILRFYLDRERGDYARALARYNGSLGRAPYPNSVLEACTGHWSYPVRAAGAAQPERRAAM